MTVKNTPLRARDVCVCAVINVLHACESVSICRMRECVWVRVCVCTSMCPNVKLEVVAVRGPVTNLLHTSDPNKPDD